MSRILLDESLEIVAANFNLTYIEIMEHNFVYISSSHTKFR